MPATVSPGEDALLAATALLDEGELVILPTGTSYVLAGDALHEEAVQRLFRAVERAADAPLATMVSGFEDIGHLAFITPLARQLTDAFWPGPLALRLRGRAWLPEGLAASDEHVEVRAADHAFTRDLARHFGPLALVEARRSGGPEPTTLAIAQQQVGPEAALAVDGGPLPGGVPTLVDATGPEASVLSEGKVASAEVLAHGRRRD